MSERGEAVCEAADAEKCERLKGEGAALFIDDMDQARAFVEKMGDHSVERLAQACLERGRVPSLVARISGALRVAVQLRPELRNALRKSLRNG